MKILVLSLDIPAPVHRPGSPRPYYFCEELAKNHELFLGTLCEDKEQLQWLTDDPSYAAMFREIEVLPPPPRKVGWWNRQRHRASFSVYYYTKHLHPAYHRQMLERITRWVREKNIDLVYVNGMEMTQYVSPALGIPAISDVCDCLSLLFQKTAAAKKSPILKLRFLLESYSLARWERALARAFSLLIVISPLDEKGLKRSAPHARTLIIPNGVDVDYFKPQGSPQKSRIVFTGVMSYPPNEDAVLYFAESVFPLIKRKIPDAEFWAVGKGPSERIRALVSGEGVHVTGTVEDIREYLSSARVFVLPFALRRGREKQNPERHVHGAPGCRHFGQPGGHRRRSGARRAGGRHARAARGGSRKGLAGRWPCAAPGTQRPGSRGGTLFLGIGL